MNAKSTFETPEFLEKIYSQKLSIGSAIGGLAAATGTSCNLVGLAISSILGGLAGPTAFVEGPLGEPLHPGFNLIIADNDPNWHQLQRVVLGAVESLQRQLREIGQISTEDSITRKPFEDGNRNLGKEIRECFDKHMDQASPVAAILDHARPGLALRLPSMVMNSPTPESFAAGIEEILDREVAVYYPHGGLFQEIAKLSPSRRWHQFLGQLVQALEGSDASFQPICENSGFGSLSMLRARLLMTCNASHIRVALASNNSDVQRFLNQCLIIRPKRWSAAPSIRPLELKGVYSSYASAVKNVMANRRCGQSAQLTVDAAGYDILSQYSDFLRAKAASIDLPGHPWIIMDLHWKLMWSMKVLYPRAADIAAAAIAVHLGHCAINEHLALVSEERQMHETQAAEKARKIMLSKLRELGDVTVRDLLRTYNNQRKDLHLPVLEGLIQQGLINQTGNIICLADTTKP